MPKAFLKEEQRTRVAQPNIFMNGIVLASSQGDDASNLHALLAGSAWKLIAVPTCSDAAWAIRHLRVPIVLCDLTLEDQPWQQTLRMLRRARNRTCVIFLSNEPDTDLAGEVAKGGGFDLLVRPFERAQVLQSLFFAYGQYKLTSTSCFLGRMENSRIARL
jgi:DNA-binding NtrC family response regulator